MINVRDVVISSGDFKLKDISFQIAEGKCLALMGPSGAGKSTIMEAICGLRELVSGEIVIDGENVSSYPPSQRSVGLVPQDNALFPSMSVEEQICYGPRIRQWSEERITEKLKNISEPLGITHLLKRSIYRLSGGEAKRVAIARALAYEPKLLCLDESFTGLDSETQSTVLESVQWAIQNHSMAALFITHQQSEAEMLADQCAVLENGILVQ